MDYEAFHRELTTRVREQEILKHTKDVVSKALELYKKANLKESLAHLVEEAAWLHDIGKYATVTNKILGRVYESDYEQLALHAIVGANYLNNGPNIPVNKGVPDIVARHTSIPWSARDIHAIGERIELDKELRRPIPNPFSKKVEFTYRGVTYIADVPSGDLQRAMIVLVLADNSDKNKVNEFTRKQPFLHGEAGKCLKKNVYTAAKMIGLEAEFAEFDVNPICF
jgi:putative nucleotidyltransferase with HDIG domain